MLLIVFPCTLVACSPLVCVDPKSICLVAIPLTVIDVPVRMEKLSFPASMIKGPVTFVASSIWPCHFALSMSQATFPHSLVDCTCFVNIFFDSSWCIEVEFLKQSLFRFMCFEILGCAIVVCSLEAIFLLL